MVKTEVLEKIASRDLRVYYVWLPTMPKDDAAAARKSAEPHSDPRISHFWDGDKGLGWAMGAVLGLPPKEGEQGHAHRVAWDAYFLYGRGVRWKPRAPPPAPTFWMHQLWGAEKLAPFLDGAVLRTQVEAALRGKH